VQSQRFWVGEVRWFPFPIDPSLPDEVFGSYGFSPKAGSKHTTHLDASKVAKQNALLSHLATWSLYTWMSCDDVVGTAVGCGGGVVRPAQAVSRCPNLSSRTHVAGGPLASSFSKERKIGK
jgi:hypothetical protein